MKDCGCLPAIHEGAHWLHMDRLIARMNFKLFEVAERDASWLALHAFAKEEERRLETKLHEMKLRGVDQICARASGSEQ